MRWGYQQEPPVTQHATTNAHSAWLSTAVAALLFDPMSCRETSWVVLQSFLYMHPLCANAYTVKQCASQNLLGH